MKNIARMAALAAAATIAATPAIAVPVGVEVPATTRPTANVTITKPLTQTRDREERVDGGGGPLGPADRSTHDVGAVRFVPLRRFAPR